MWTRIVNRSSYSALSRSFQQKHANTALLPCLFESILRCADKDPSSSLRAHPSMMIGRQKHSQTQIKRLFKRNPARLRVEKRMWNIDRKQPKVLFPMDHDTNTVATSPSQLTSGTMPTMDSTSTNTAADQQLSEDVTTALPLNGSHDAESAPQPALLYPPVYTIPTILPNGWFPPMDPTLRPNYPFSIRRTKNKPKDSVGFLPIYTKYRKDNTKVVTRIKNVSGDIDIFLRELRIVLSLPEPANQLQSYDDIRLRAGNMIEIQDHRAKEIRRWLGELGF